MPANSTMSSKRRAMSWRASPRMRPYRPTFSRPVSSGCMPVPTSISAPTRPRTASCPDVGYAMRVASFSVVVLPAPLTPMIPNDSPSGISKLTRFSARTVWRVRFVRRPRKSAPRSSRSARYSLAPRYSFVTLSNVIAFTVSSDAVGEAALQPLEERVADRPEQERPQRGACDRCEARPAAAEREPHRADRGRDGIRDLVQRAPVRGDDRERIDDRAREQPDLEHERQRITDVAVVDVEAGQREPDRAREEDDQQRREREREPGER